jgi:hypothetical protein
MLRNVTNEYQQLIVLQLRVLLKINTDVIDTAWGPYKTD